MNHGSFDHRHFPTTHWSEIQRIGNGDSAQQRTALDAWLRNYLPALKTHLVLRKNIDPNTADDFLQDFVTTKILDKDLLALADPQKGKFRSLLLTVLDRMIIDVYRRRVPIGAALNDDEKDEYADAGEQPDVFDTAWAQLVLADTIRLLKDDCQSQNQPSIWLVFVERLLKPLVSQHAPTDYEELVQTGQFKTTKAARNALVNAKKKFRRFMQQVIGKYIRSPDEIGEEVQCLQSILASSKSLDIPLDLLTTGLQPSSVELLSSISARETTSPSQLMLFGQHQAASAED